MPTMYEEELGTASKKSYEAQRKESHDILYSKRPMVMKEYEPKAKAPEEKTETDEEQKAAAKAQDEYASHVVNIINEKNKGYFAYNPFDRGLKSEAAGITETKAEERTSVQDLPSSLSPDGYAISDSVSVGNGENPVTASESETVNSVGSASEENETLSEEVVASETVISPGKAVESLSLSLNTKVVLVMVATIVIVLFSVIFVNSSLVNSLEEEARNKQSQIEQVMSDYDVVNEEIVEATGREAAEEYAKSAGMIIK